MKSICTDNKKKICSRECFNILQEETLTSTFILVLEPVEASGPCAKKLYIVEGKYNKLIHARLKNMYIDILFSFFKVSSFLCTELFI